MNEVKCKKCGVIQYSIMDKEYAILFPQCWSCDNEAYWSKKLPLKMFEQRETEALNKAMK